MSVLVPFSNEGPSQPREAFAKRILILFFVATWATDVGANAYSFRPGDLREPSIPIFVTGSRGPQVVHGSVPLECHGKRLAETVALAGVKSG